MSESGRGWRAKEPDGTLRRMQRATDPEQRRGEAGAKVARIGQRRAKPPPASFWTSLKAAASGVGGVIASQRNMKLHVLSADAVIIVGMALPFDLSMRSTLLFAIGVVFFAEILNTGLESLVDLFVGEFHRLAMLAKDAAAAGVLVFAVITVLVLTDMLWTRWDLVTSHLDAVWRSVAFGVPLLISEAIGLFALRRGPGATLRLLLSGALAVPLVLASKDPIFSGVLLALLGLAAWARHAFPSRTGRGAPAPAEPT